MKEKIQQALKQWNPEIQLTVVARFIQKGADRPLHGSEYIVRLYDRDIFGDDDYLGSSKLNENGEAHIHFFPSDIANADAGLESLPDLYILLFKDDVVHFQSKVWDDVDFDKLGHIDLREGDVLNFGTFLVG
ncbi:MAG: hypothetical protein IPH78_02840 [Bacteroidetes bacterium]|nr:hypothetical protein [Bacteroidota bacterium]MBK8657549.1 hypothetical protein [Bacteroidota bacterium]